MDVLILVLAVALISVFCYKNVPTVVGGIVCSLLLLVVYKMDLYTGLLDTYMGGLVGFMKQWFIMFTLALCLESC